MARSAKNLREIINVSRLSIRDYSSDEFSSEHEYDEFEELHSYISSRPSSALSSESNFATVMLNTKTGSTQGRYCYTNKHHVPCRPNTAPANNMKGKSPPKKYASGRNTVPFASNNVQSFPSKYTPVPPIVPRNFSKESKSGSISENSQLSNNIKLDIDCLFQYLDATIISGWIESCNDTLNDINIFIVQDNFVEFANFFLNSLSHDQYCKLLELEFSIIIDQLCYLFHAGLHDGRISSKDLLSLADIVMKEYPKALQTKSKGPKLLLDIIIIFCSEKDDTYRNLLKNIKYSTKNKQIVQWLLAIRAFGLIGFVSGILKFYKNILSLQERLVPKEPGSSSHIGLSCTELWCLQAVQRNYCEVVQYLFYHQHIEIKNILDVKERNLLSVAASEGYSEMIKFLMKLCSKFDIDQPSENGNTALHFVVSKSDIKCARALLQAGADVNMWNEQSNGATALHSAVMLGDVTMVRLLLQYNADRTIRMGMPATVTPISLALDLGHMEIVQLLKK